MHIFIKVVEVTIRVCVSDSCRVDSWVSYKSTLTTCLLNGSRFLNTSTTHLLNGPIVLTCLLDFIKMKKEKEKRINQIELWKTKKINIFNIKFKTNK